MLSLQVHLLPGWSDVTAHNPDGGPTYTLHGHDLRLWYTPFVCISVLSLEEYADDPDRVY
jgi:hypothetical protein